jgi:hypothetical protein
MGDMLRILGLLLQIISIDQDECQCPLPVAPGQKHRDMKQGRAFILVHRDLKLANVEFNG